MIPTGDRSFEAVHISSFKQMWVKYLVCRVAAVSFEVCCLQSASLTLDCTYFGDYTLCVMLLYVYSWLYILFDSRFWLEG